MAYVYSYTATVVDANYSMFYKQSLIFYLFF